MVTQEQLNSWYNHTSNKEQFIEQNETRECPEGICDGSGYYEPLELVSGDNIVPGGFYEGSGNKVRCLCNLEEESNDE